MIKKIFIILTFFSSSLTAQPSRTFQIIPPGTALSRQITGAALNTSIYATRGLFKITEPGYYMVSTDLSVAPTRSNLSILHIDASNVIVDLGSKTLTLSTTNHTTIPSAIYIAPHAHNITIMNGTINGAGVHASIKTGIVGTNNSGVHIDNVRIINCKIAGITIDTSSNVSMSGIHAHNNGSIGLYLKQCTSGFVTDSTFDGDIAQAIDSYGLWASNCKGFTLENITVSDISTTTSNAFGIHLDSCSGFSCNNLQVSNNTTHGNNTTCIGISLKNSRGCQLQNCSASNNTSIGSNAHCFGFLCNANSTNNRLQSCLAINNYSDGALTAGFALNSASNTSFDACESIGNQNTTQSVYGFYSSNNGARNFFRTCKANGNTSSNGKAVGLGLDSEQRSVISNSEINANEGGSGEAYGIALTGTCKNTTVEFNKMLSNYATTKLYGFKDFAINSTTLLRGNISFGHGSVFLSGNILADSGKMNYMLSFSDNGDQKNPQFIIKEADTANMNAFEAGSLQWFNFSILS